MSPIAEESNSQYMFEVRYKGKHCILNQYSKHLHRLHQTGGKEELSINSNSHTHLTVAQFHHAPTSALTKPVISLSLSSKIHGSKEHEKKKESFYARHLALSRHVGSVKFEMANVPLTLSCSLKSCMSIG